MDRISYRHNFQLDDFDFFLEHSERDLHYKEVFSKYFKEPGNSKPVRGPFRLLDVGCGTGELTSHVLQLVTRTYQLQYGISQAATRNHSIEAYLIDPVPDAIDRTKAAVSPLQSNHCEIISIQSTLETFAENLIYGSSGIKFDLILCSHVFYYFEDWKEAIETILSLLKPQGILCVILKSKDSDFFHLRQSLFKQIDHDNRNKHEFAEDLLMILDKRNIPFSKSIETFPITIPYKEMPTVAKHYNLSPLIRILNFIYHYPIHEYMHNPQVNTMIRQFADDHTTPQKGFSACFRDICIWI